MAKGWIKLHRKILDSPLWKDLTPNQKVITITILLLANHEENRWIFNGEEYTVKAGQFITSIKSLSEVTKCSPQVIRTCLLKLVRYGFLTNQSTNRNRLITIVNWELYQNEDEGPTNQLTSTQQAPNKHLTTNKNDKNDKNDKNNNIYIGHESGKYTEIIDYLNQQTGKSYKASTPKTKDLINARMKEGFSVEDFKKVIDNKVKAWKNDLNMCQYLRPMTLFGNKFESYLNDVPVMTEEEEKYEYIKELEKQWIL